MVHTIVHKRKKLLLLGENVWSLEYFIVCFDV